MPRSLLPVVDPGVGTSLAERLRPDRLVHLAPVLVLSVLALGLTAAWNESRTELAYLRASTPVPAALTEGGEWVAAAGEPSAAQARAFSVAEVHTPASRSRWLGLVGTASFLSFGLALARRRETALPAISGRPVPLVPTLA
jgi:hypothetical protein